MTGRHGCGCRQRTTGRGAAPASRRGGPGAVQPRRHAGGDGVERRNRAGLGRADGEGAGAPFEHEDRVMSVGFDPTGQRVVTTSADRTARLWRIAPDTGQRAGNGGSEGRPRDRRARHRMGTRRPGGRQPRGGRPSLLPRTRRTAKEGPRRGGSCAMINGPTPRARWCRRPSARTDAGWRRRRMTTRGASGMPRRARLWLTRYGTRIRCAGWNSVPREPGWSPRRGIARRGSGTPRRVIRWGRPCGIWIGCAPPASARTACAS
jgi:hypothetical protein